MKILKCKNLTVGYDHKPVCNNITFTLNKGDYLCVVGENGTGKSTLIKTILGLEKSLGGKIAFNKNFNRKKVGYLPQQTELQKDFPAIVNEVVMSGFLNNSAFRPFYNKQEKERASEVLKALEIEHLQLTPYRELSGGQQQRVLLARALCATKDLLVLDEPTSGLDAKSIDSFYKLLKSLNQKGLTILMISHNISKVLEYASDIVLLKNRMEFFGSKTDFLKKGFAKAFSSSKHKGEIA